MNRIYIRRRTEAEPAGPKDLSRTLRRQMAWAAGTEQFQHRDPIYHVTESFQQTFDAMGRRHAAQLAGGETEEHAGAQPGQPQEEAGQMPDPTSARGFYERSSPDDQDMLRRFSETAFQRGTLSGAVLQGTGQMMLFSCLKKYVRLHLLGGRRSAQHPPQAGGPDQVRQRDPALGRVRRL